MLQNAQIYNKTEQTSPFQGPIILWLPDSAVSNRIKHFDVVQCELLSLMQPINKARHSQFGPIRIYTLTDLGERPWKAASLPRNQQTERGAQKAPPQINYCQPTLCYWLLHSHNCSGLQESSVLLFNLQERTGRTCPHAFKAPGGSTNRVNRAGMHRSHFSLECPLKVSPH